MPPLRGITALVLLLAAAGCAGDDGSATDDPKDTDVAPVGEAPQVVSITPADGASGVSVDATIVITFSEPVDAATGTAVLSHDAVVCQHTWNEARDTLTLTPDEPLGALVTYQVEVSGFADDDGLALEQAFQSSFQTELVERLAPQPPSGGSSWSFTNVAAAAGVADDFFFFDTPFFPMHPLISGASTADYDDDGFIDLYTGRGDTGTTHLYRNKGDGTFEDVSVAAGVLVDDAIVVDPTFVDHDGDGDLDLLVPAFENSPTRFFLNNGDGTFTDGTAQAGIVHNGKDWYLDTFSSTWADYDLDGDIDVFMARFTADDPTDPRFLWKNNGDGTFSDATIEAELWYLDIVQSFTPNFADMNDDGYPELLIACDHGYSVYMRNDGDGTFTRDLDVELTDENGMGATVADYDHDGDLDWFVGAIYDPNGISEHRWGVEGNRLYQNDGEGNLVDVSEDMGVRDGAWAWGTCSADFDLDGYEDFYQVNGEIDDRDVNDEYIATTSRLFHNNGDGTFTEMAVDLGIDAVTIGKGVSCFDMDRDGDVDVFEANWNMPPNLWRNDGDDHGHFLNIRLAGRGMNTMGIGARIYVTANGITQMREVHLGSNYNSHDPVEEVIGLGPATVVDELRVHWPDGTENVATAVAADRFVLISQPPPVE